MLPDRGTVLVVLLRRFTLEERAECTQNIARCNAMLDGFARTPEQIERAFPEVHEGLRNIQNGLRTLRSGSCGLCESVELTHGVPQPIDVPLLVVFLKFFSPGGTGSTRLITSSE